MTGALVYGGLPSPINSHKYGINLDKHQMKESTCSCFERGLH